MNDLESSAKVAHERQSMWPWDSLTEQKRQEWRDRLKEPTPTPNADGEK